VGLAGLLDLGYVAFLGIGAFTAANLAHTLPFPLAALAGAAVAGFFGAVVGSPTLRVRGDYLAYGDQRRLEIARALASDPAVLMLDEPTAGMNAIETADIRTLIGAIRDRGIAVVVIEHDTKFIFSLCDHVYVLVRGRILIDGPPQAVRTDPRVIEAYLGTT
jgi:ABC-type uncharacterized transport system ATPase subunit